MAEVMLADKKIIIVSYTHVMRGEFTKLGGPALALKDFLKTRVARLTCIWQPLPISDTLDALAQVYERGSVSTYRLPMPNWPWDREGGINFLYVALKPRDIVATLYFTLRLKGRYDYLIGVEALNALVGVLLRKVGIVRKVVYYSLDYGEVRFKNRVLNSIFHSLDRLAVRFSDCVWNLSPEMANARERLVGNELRAAPQIAVPIGTDTDRIERLPFERIEKNWIVYLGLLSDNTGVSLIFDALPEIVARRPGVRLVIVGSGPLEDALRARANEMGLSSKIDFMGRVTDDEVERTLSRCAVGIAPYLSDPNSIKKYTDVTKPRMYMTCGLSVIITDVPPVAKEIAARRAGIVIDYERGALVDAVTRILSDENLLRELRQNAVNLASQYSWVDIFSHAFAETMARMGEPEQINVVG